METGSLGISVCIRVETRVYSVRIDIYSICMSLLLVYLFVKKAKAVLTSHKEIIH